MRRILVVDDDPDMRESLARLLRGSYEVTTAANAEEARRLLSLQRFDVVLLDVWMPDAIGTSVVRMLRASGNSVPVILVSADPHVAARAEEWGAVAWVRKPYAGEELLEKIAACATPTGLVP